MGTRYRLQFSLVFQSLPQSLIRGAVHEIDARTPHSHRQNAKILRTSQTLRMCIIRVPKMSAEHVFHLPRCHLVVDEERVGPLLDEFGRRRAGSGALRIDDAAQSPKHVGARVWREGTYVDADVCCVWNDVHGIAGVDVTDGDDGAFLGINLSSSDGLKPDYRMGCCNNRVAGAVGLRSVSRAAMDFESAGRDQPL